MNDEVEGCQQRGAELACIAAISLRDNGETSADSNPFDRMLRGRPAWRRGMAHVLVNKISGGSAGVCFNGLLRLLDDDDPEVRRFIGRVFNSMGDRHLRSQQVFLEFFASSPAMPDGFHEFTEYLDNPHSTSRHQRATSGERLVRIVLRVYTDPAVDDPVRERSMALFDRLMDKNSHETHMVLGEWDRR